MSPKKILDSERRFIAFAKTLPGAECVDEIELTPEQKKARKADFFFDNRRIICELKSLKTDTGGKVEKVLEPHKQRPEWPIFFGKMSLHQILKHLPDGERVNRQIFDAVTTAIKELVRSANDQIRQTKKTFGLQSAGGMLVILNEFIDILSPDVIAYKVDELFRKRTPEGNPQFPEINAVWILNESHYTQVTPDLQGIPALIMKNVVPDPANVAGYIDSLQPKWAQYHGVPLVTFEGRVLDEVKFESIKKGDSGTDGKIPRHEMWRRQYRLRPYLQPLSKQELIEYFGRLLAAIKPGFLKGGTKEQIARMRGLMEPWTHLLEEVNRRGLDMREFTTAIKVNDGEGVMDVGADSRPVGGVSASEEEASVLITQHTQGPSTVEYHTGGAINTRTNFYALSLVAARVVDGNVHLDNMASYAPAPIDSEEAAYEYGLREAREKWPAEEGWSHGVDVKLVVMKFEFGSKGTS